MFTYKGSSNFISGYAPLPFSIHSLGFQWFPLTTLRLTHPYLFPPSSKAEIKVPTKTPVLPMRYIVSPRGAFLYPRVLKRTKLTMNATNMNRTRYVGYDPFRILKRTEPTEIHGTEAVPVWADDTKRTTNPQNKRMHTVRNKI